MRVKCFIIELGCAHQSPSPFHGYPADVVFLLFPLVLTYWNLTTQIMSHDGLLPLPHVTVVRLKIQKKTPDIFF